MGKPVGVAIARLGRPHGIGGELAASPQWDGDPSPLVGLRVRIEELPGDYVIDSIRGSRDRWILALLGIETPEAAQRFTNRSLLASPSDLPPSLGGAPYHFELIGMEVVDEAGRSLGQVRSVLEAPAGDLLVLDEAGDVMIPFRPMVKSIDRAARRLTVELPPGLLEVNAKPKASS